MYTVTLKTESYYQKITRYKVSDIDPDFFTFYWEDGTYITIQKEYVVSIRKNH